MREQITQLIHARQALWRLLFLLDAQRRARTDTIAEVVRFFSPQKAAYAAGDKMAGCAGLGVASRVSCPARTRHNVMYTR